ncbi:phosphonate metabolism protein PhnP [Eionea flava]
MIFQFLGTGNAAQVPCYGCDCAACVRARNITTFRRGPCSAKITVGNTHLLIDAGHTDLTERFPVGTINTILLTHYHMDHVQGLFPLRWGKGARIPVIGPHDEQGCDDLFKHPGILEFLSPPEPFSPFYLLGIEVTAVPLNHSKPTVGYLLNDGNYSIAYLTDTLGLPEDTFRFLQKHRPDILIIDCSSPPKPNPRNHNTLNEALDIIESLAPKRAYLTHISHDLDNFFITSQYPLPDNVFVAKDNEKIITESLNLSSNN